MIRIVQRKRTLNLLGASTVLGPFLPNTVFPDFSLSFQEKQEILPTLGNLTEGKVFGTLPLFALSTKRLDDTIGI